MGLCQRCKKAQATIHVTNITQSSETVERHLCEKCAVEEGLAAQPQAPAFTTEALQNFVEAAKSVSTTQANIVCEECGLSYLEFRNQGLLGCPADYDAFKSALLPLIQRAHDDHAQHVGKSPKSLGKTRTPHQEIHRLKRLLKEAVSGEDYERAAELRDRIRQQEQA